MKIPRLRFVYVVGYGMVFFQNSFWRIPNGLPHTRHDVERIVHLGFITLCGRRPAISWVTHFISTHFLPINFRYSRLLTPLPFPLFLFSFDITGLLLFSVKMARTLPTSSNSNLGPDTKSSKKKQKPTKLPQFETVTPGTASARKKKTSKGSSLQSLSMKQKVSSVSSKTSSPVLQPSEPFLLKKTLLEVSSPNLSAENPKEDLGSLLDVSLSQRNSKLSFCHLQTLSN